LRVHFIVRLWFRKIIILHLHYYSSVLMGLPDIPNAIQIYPFKTCVSDHRSLFWLKHSIDLHSIQWNPKSLPYPAKPYMICTINFYLMFYCFPPPSQSSNTMIISCFKSTVKLLKDKEKNLKSCQRTKTIPPLRSNKTSWWLTFQEKW